MVECNVTGTNHYTGAYLTACCQALLTIMFTTKYVAAALVRRLKPTRCKFIYSNIKMQHTYIIALELNWYMVKAPDYIISHRLDNYINPSYIGK